VLYYSSFRVHRDLHSFPTRRSSDLESSYKKYKSYLFRNKDKIIDAYESIYQRFVEIENENNDRHKRYVRAFNSKKCTCGSDVIRSEEHTSELQSRENLVCRLLLEKK